MNIHLSTIFDSNYLIKAITLYKSALEYVPDCQFSFLCLDDESKKILDELKLPNLQTNIISDLKNIELEKVRQSRTRGEFAFTAKSNYLAYLIKTTEYSFGDIIIWADADILFYSSAKQLINEVLRGHSIIRTSHKFKTDKEYLNEKVGKYNAGMIFFKIDENSKQCIQEWSKQCIDWCFHRLEDGKLGDQMYLNDWHNKYKGVYDLPHKGVNTGTWNINNYKVTNVANRFYLDNEILICYHFHGIKTSLHRNRIKIYPISIYHKDIYNVYTKALYQALKLVQTIRPSFDKGFDPRLGILKTLKQNLQRFYRTLNV